MTDLASIPGGRKLRSMSTPQLVIVIRRLTREHTIFKLKNEGRDPPTGPFLRAALDEAKRRNITIDHPENHDD